MERRRNLPRVTAALWLSLTLVACGSQARDTSVDTRSPSGVDARSASGSEGKDEAPAFSSIETVGVAGPDGEMMEGLRVSVKDREARSLRIYEHMKAADISSFTLAQSQAFSFVEASPVVDEDGRLAGYFADRFYSAEEYERLLPEQERIVGAAGG